MDKNPLLHRLMKDTKDDVIHSSGYAEAQNSGSMGAASAASFAARQALEQNRTTIKKYSASQIANNSYGNTMRAKTYEPKKEAPNYVDRFKNNQAGSSNTPPTPENRPAPPARKNPGIFR